MNAIDSLRRIFDFRSVPRLKHGFRRWIDGRVVCMCGWESKDSYRMGIRQLHEHEQRMLPRAG